MEESKEKGLKAYAELTANLDPAEKADLDDQLGQLPSDPKRDIEIADQIKQGLWDELFSRDHFPLEALHCVREGLIPPMTFSSSQMFYNVWTHPRNHHAVQIKRVFTNGEINPLSRKMIDATMVLPNSGELSDWESPEEEQRFYEILSRLPESEQCFLLVPEPNNPVETSLVHHINKRLGFNIFSRLTVDGNPVCMIPSRGMMQAYLEATRENNVPRAVYRFALSPIDELSDVMKSGGRVLFQAFALLSHRIPHIIDGFRARPECAEADIHDFYHWVLAADIPLCETKLFAAIADHLFLIAETDPSCKAYAEKLAAKIVDLEHRRYDRKLKNPQFLAMHPEIKKQLNTGPFQIFWDSIRVCDLRVQQKLKDPQDVLVDHVMQWLLENEGNLERDFGMTLETLLKHAPASRNEIVAKLRAEIKMHVCNEVQGKSLPQLLRLMFFLPRSESFPSGRLLHSAAVAEAERKVDEAFEPGCVR